MMRRVLPFRPLHVPRYGRIVGGLLDGWNFTFYRVVIVNDCALIEVYAQEACWPFPPKKPVRMKPTDFYQLVPAPGAPHTDTRTHVASLLMAAEIK